MGPIDPNDLRMQQVSFANGLIYGALDTGLVVNNVSSRMLRNERPDLAKHYWRAMLWSPSYFAASCGGAPLDIIKQYVEQQNRPLRAGGAPYIPPQMRRLRLQAATRPTHLDGALRRDEVIGNDHFPSAGYASLNVQAGAGPIVVATQGRGPRMDTPNRQYGSPLRWGDYSAAATDGANIYLGTEYIGQTCTFSEWRYVDFTCGGTRAQLGNWGTRITKVMP